MCSSQTQQFIAQVVSNKMASDVMFTLFDITLEVKKLEKAAGLQVSRHNEIHDDVAAEVRQQIVPAGWQRQLQTMGNGLSAFVHYNSNTHDPATYLLWIVRTPPPLSKVVFILLLSLSPPKCRMTMMMTTMTPIKPLRLMANLPTVGGGFGSSPI